MSEPHDSPRQWLRRALAEWRAAEEAYAAHNSKAGLIGAKRAAGMALRGALLLQPSERYGRNYMQHVAALADDPSAPEAVRRAAERLHRQQPAGLRLVSLRRPRENDELLQAARDVMAHAYAVVVRAEASLPREMPS